MSIHSLSSLNQKKQYVHFVVPFLNKIRKLFGPSLASAWEVFYTESRATHGVLRKTYAYLADKIGCSRRTVIRYAKKMAEKGILIINHMFNHNCNLENEFILLTPEEALIAAEKSPDREKPDLDIDYSVNYLVENSNSVDKSVTSCHPSITTLNQEKNIKSVIRKSRITEPKTAIHALRQVDQEKISKSVSIKVVRYLEKFIKGQKWVSNPTQLIQEAVYFVANRKEGFSEWAAVGRFRKHLGKDGCGGWQTPWGMRTRESKYDEEK
jgi:DNA-binding Lrp family transcriptional regulator